MFGIGWTEFILIGILALLVLGPEKLPEVARQLGKWVRELRLASAHLREEFQAGWNEGGDPWETPPPTSTTGSPEAAAAPAHGPLELPPAEPGFGKPRRHRSTTSPPEEADQPEEAP